jgi:hypothetical protein
MKQTWFARSVNARFFSSKYILIELSYRGRQGIKHK